MSNSIYPYVVSRPPDRPTARLQRSRSHQISQSPRILQLSINTLHVCSRCTTDTRLCALSRGATAPNGVRRLLVDSTCPVPLRCLGVSVCWSASVVYNVSISIQSVLRPLRLVGSAWSHPPTIFKLHFKLLAAEMKFVPRFISSEITKLALCSQKSTLSDRRALSFCGSGGCI